MVPPKAFMKFLDDLLNAAGPSGTEGAPRKVWRTAAEEFASHIETDVSGNAYATVGPREGPQVMLAGHIDEIGLMVHHIDDNGYLYIKPIGGWDAQVLVGQRVRVLTEDGPIQGVVGRPPIHLIDREARKQAAEMKEMYLDIGAEDGEEARQKVSIGDSAIVDSRPIELGDHQIAGRAIDDRVGAAIVLEAARRAHEAGQLDCQVVAVATAMEEIGTKGATTSSFRLDPDAALVVDVTHATDYPGVDPSEHGKFEVGQGPVITRGPVANPEVFRRLVETARQQKLDYQIQAEPMNSSCDADAIYTQRDGVATGIVSVPNRYMHSPIQTVSRQDLEGAVQLLVGFLEGLDASADFRP